MGMAAAVIGAGALSAGASLIGSSNAASAQQSAANQASATQMAMFQQEQQNLQPYMQNGLNAQNMLTGQLPSLKAPINMNQATLEQTPGYQFQLSQGLKATQNSAAQRGLGISGAAMKASDAYAQGLASENYKQQFNNAQTNRQTTFNMLTDQQKLGKAQRQVLGRPALRLARVSRRIP